MKTSQPLVVFLLIIIFFSQTIAQTKKEDFLEQFEKKVTKENYKRWDTYSDNKVGGGSSTKLSYKKDASRKSQVLCMSYSLLKKEWDYPPYAGISCAVDYRVLPGPVKGITYQYKGPAHTFTYISYSSTEYYCYRKKIPLSNGWTTVTIPFSELKIDGSVKVNFDCFDLSGLTWLISGKDLDSGNFYLDDIRFVPAEDSSLGPQKQTVVDTVAGIVFTPYHDSTLAYLPEYKKVSSSYYNAVKCIEHYEKRIDSLCKYVRGSSFSMKDKEVMITLLSLSKNLIPGDISIKAKEKGFAWKKKYSSIIEYDTLCKIDRNFRIVCTNLNSTFAKAKDWHQYSFYDEKFDWSKDTSRRKEVRLYNFHPGDTIAEIGVGNGNFEKSIANYCDNLIVYANDIDSANMAKLSVKLKLLEKYDRKDIQFLPVVGHAKASRLPEGKMDKIIIRNTFHHFTHPDEMTKDLKKALAKGGKLFIVDVMKDEVEKPDCPLFMERGKFMNYFTSNGFQLTKETPLEYAHFILFEFTLVP